MFLELNTVWEGDGSIQTDGRAGSEWDGLEGACKALSGRKIKDPIGGGGGGCRVQSRKGGR